MVAMVEEGDIGRYNRANRATAHFLENAMSVPISMVMAGYIFPFPVLILTIVYCLGRVCY